MNKLLIAALLILTSCAQNLQGPTGNQGPKGDKGDTPSLPKSLSGFYLLQDGGYIELLKDNGDLYDILQGRLVIKNSDGSFGVLPISSFSNIPMMNNKLLYVTSVSFSAPNNIKTDVGNTVLVGSFLTVLVIENVNDKLKLTVQISNSTNVVTNKTVNVE